ncbi:hypothetical protein JW865_00780 [Candidatus Bathyarchaeota archaeon]|nr:hypothetical protein [Candidatus Bathyarchaeota archaeon]
MWKVKSETGKMNAVLFQDSVESFWNNRLPFDGIESNLYYTPRCHHADINPGYKQWLELKNFLGNENIQLFEVVDILKKGIEKATSKERQEIIKEVWGKDSTSPKPEELNVEHLIYGFPSKPYYNTDDNKVVLPDFRRVSWPYSRDTSFTTPIGTVLCKMRRYSRQYEPRIVKLAYNLDPILKEKIEFIYDANETGDVLTEQGYLEGGDTHIIDEETIAIGIGQRSNLIGFKKCIKEIFDKDIDGTLKYICAVQLPDFPAVDYMHLDVIINYPNKKQALIMPYIWDTNVIPNLPPKKLLLKTLDSLAAHSQYHNRPLEKIVTSETFKDCGRTHVYIKKQGNIIENSTEISLLDFLVKQDKLDKDNLLFVAGKPINEYDLDHLYSALFEQARGSCNIITLRPGKVIAFKRNTKTLAELKENGVNVLEWNDSHLDMLGGPHCSTCPLSRES